ncbi:MAG: hypothetical protein ABSF94_16870 [Steroidobacteraceae bacterium]|jgi:hypothetical protein
MTASATFAARLLSLYRIRLEELLTRLEVGSRDQESNIRFVLGTIIEQLGTDLMSLYHESARGSLIHSDQTIVLPALERMRDVLRRAHRRPVPLRDALHKAIAAMPSNPP